MSKLEEFPQEESIEDLIPEKYRNLPSEVVEELWTIPEYVEEGKTEGEKEKKGLIVKNSW